MEVIRIYTQNGNTFKGRRTLRNLSMLNAYEESVNDPSRTLLIYGLETFFIDEPYDEFAARLDHEEAQAKLDYLRGERDII